MIHDFIDTIRKNAIEKYVPVSMPASVGSLGFDAPIWVGLGIVGLWAALDAFAERAKLNRIKCAICEGKCIPSTFAGYTQGNEGQALQELEDLRHLYAHNYAGGSSAAHPRGPLTQESRSGSGHRAPDGGTRKPQSQRVRRPMGPGDPRAGPGQVARTPQPIESRSRSRPCGNGVNRARNDEANAPALGNWGVETRRSARTRPNHRFGPHHQRR